MKVVEPKKSSVEMVNRTFLTFEDMIEAILAARKRYSNLLVKVDADVISAANEAAEEEKKNGLQKTPYFETKGFGSLLSSIIIPGEKIQFDVDGKPAMVMTLSIDFSAQTSYCGMY